MLHVRHLQSHSIGKITILTLCTVYVLLREVEECTRLATMLWRWENLEFSKTVAQNRQYLRHHGPRPASWAMPLSPVESLSLASTAKPVIKNIVVLGHMFVHAKLV